MKTSRVKINGRIAEVCTLGELSKFCGRKPGTFRKFEQRGILPPANFRGQPKQDGNGSTIEGERLYTVELAKVLKQIFSGVSQGTQVTDEQKRQIAVAFIEEKTKYE